MSTAVRPTIVVGVSGSPASAVALRWGAAETARRSGHLRVVQVWKVEPRAFYAPPISSASYDRRQALAAEDLAATLRLVLGPDVPATVTAEVTEGLPERALVERSAGADLLVLGSAAGFMAGRSIGPVIRACLSRAHCPVVVVNPDGPSASDAEYLGWQQASRRDDRDAMPVGAGASAGGQPR